jgi:hypothetical protein
MRSRGLHRRQPRLWATVIGDRSQLDAAKEFLLEELGDGPMEANQVLKDATEARVAQKTLYRAKDTLPVKPSKDGLGGWV